MWFKGERSFHEQSRDDPKHVISRIPEIEEGLDRRHRLWFVVCQAQKQGPGLWIQDRGYPVLSLLSEAKMWETMAEMNPYSWKHGQRWGRGLAILPILPVWGKGIQRSFSWKSDRDEGYRFLAVLNLQWEGGNTRRICQVTQHQWYDSAQEKPWQEKVKSPHSKGERHTPCR